MKTFFVLPLLRRHQTSALRDTEEGFELDMGTKNRLIEPSQISKKLGESRLVPQTQVDRVLNEIGAGDVPQIVVFNKCDLLENSRSGDVERDAAGVGQRVWVSAHDGSGLQALAQTIAERAGALRVERRLRLPPAAGRLRAKLFELGVVTAEQMEADGTSVLDVLIVPRDLQRLSTDEGLSEAMIEQTNSNAA